MLELIEKYKNKLKDLQKILEEHIKVCEKHMPNYNRYFDRVSEMDEKYVRENHPDWAESIDLIHASVERSSSIIPQKVALVDNFVVEIAQIIGKENGYSEVEPLRLQYEEMLTIIETRYEETFGSPIYLLMAAQHGFSFNEKGRMIVRITNAWIKAAKIDREKLDVVLIDIRDEQIQKLHEVGNNY